jgi:hypothetical protein
MQELMPVEDAEAEVVNGDHGLIAVEVVGVELESVAADLESAGEDGVELVELDAAVETGAEGFDDFGFEHGCGAAEKDVAGNESGDSEDGEDRADPEESDDEAMMAAAMRGRSGGFGGWRGHSSSLRSDCGPWMRVCVVRDARGLGGCTQGVGPGVILICAVAADWARGSAGSEV